MVGRKRHHQRPQNVPIAELQIHGIWGQTLDEHPENFLLADNHQGVYSILLSGMFM